MTDHTTTAFQRVYRLVTVGGILKMGLGHAYISCTDYDITPCSQCHYTTLSLGDCAGAITKDLDELSITTVHDCTTFYTTYPEVLI